MTDHALTPETLAELEQRHDEGLCLCSSSTTDWDVVPALIAAARERDAYRKAKQALDVDTAALDAAPADRDDDGAEGGGVE